MASAGTGETRVLALVGPYQSGKTQLMQAMIAACGGRAVAADASAEAKARQMGVDLNVGHFDYMGEHFAVLDCPGAVELATDALFALPAADAAIIVAEPDVAKIVALAPLIHQLEALGIPRILVLNKVDKATGSMAAMADALGGISAVPVLLRQIPIRKDGQIVGYVDLAQAKAHVYRPGQESAIVDVPAELKDRLADDRQHLLETLADFDDHLLEELLEGVDPPMDEIYTDLAADLRDGKIIPVFLTAASAGYGVRRLLKALRHELPGFVAARARLGSTGAYVLKTVHTSHAGKLSIARLLGASVKDGDSLGGQRVSGVYSVAGLTPEKLAQGKAGDIVGLGKLDDASTGQVLGGGADPVSAPSPLFSRAIGLKNRADEVKLSGALAKLTDEDPALRWGHSESTHEWVLSGQGEVHLALTLDRCKRRFGLDLQARPPQVPYCETIRGSTSQHSRFKRQSGGHGAFGDVTIEVRPTGDGTAFVFEDAITGGAIPRQYIPSVEEGVRDGLKTGPLGFPVVGVAVKLVDGKYHTVDSSDMAFQTAGRQAIQEALPNCKPVLLEPVLHVQLHVPADYTAKANQVVTSRRGQLLGYDARTGWAGWDTVEAHVPQAEMDDLIIELRSLTLGTGSFDARFDHHAEISGRLADQIIAARKAAA
jgi:elongation factor G